MTSVNRNYFEEERELCLELRLDPGVHEKPSSINREIKELLPQARRVRHNALDWNLELIQRLRLEEEERFKQQRGFERSVHN